jgi:hypothetical protein
MKKETITAMVVRKCPSCKEEIVIRCIRHIYIGDDGKAIKNELEFIPGTRCVYCKKELPYDILDDIYRRKRSIY